MSHDDLANLKRLTYRVMRTYPQLREADVDNTELEDVGLMLEHLLPRGQPIDADPSLGHELEREWAASAERASDRMKDLVKAYG